MGDLDELKIKWVFCSLRSFSSECQTNIEFYTHTCHVKITVAWQQFCITCVYFKSQTVASEQWNPTRIFHRFASVLRCRFSTQRNLADCSSQNYHTATALPLLRGLLCVVLGMQPIIQSHVKSTQQNGPGCISFPFSIVQRMPHFALEGRGKNPLRSPGASNDFKTLSSENCNSYIVRI